MASKTTGRGAKVDGRRNCTKCGRWRHALDFRPNARDDIGEAIALNYQCNWCRNQQQRAYRERPLVKKRQIRSNRAWQRQKNTRHKSVGGRAQSVGATGKLGAVPRLPIAQFLHDKLKYTTVANLAVVLQVNDKRLHAIIYGYARKRRRRGGKVLKGTALTPVDFIDIATVDRWLQLLDEPADTLDRLYPLGSEEET